VKFSVTRSKVSRNHWAVYGYAEFSLTGRKCPLYDGRRTKTSIPQKPVFLTSPRKEASKLVQVNYMAGQRAWCK
jgi:hypothetical protein